ncbi:hypothetical protein GCM10027027_16390 [Neomicrococcus lactis]|uniref:Uncharacterized protein n=1 Tax=Neomicrococcus lactis TaxID=732241 RepID=A0A7W8YC49_9MICC|nr:hypothetical protein [Neomicrococcus lactis]
MYAWIFRHLPGPTWSKVLISLLLILAAILVLAEYVFPWLNQYNPWNEPTIGTVLIRGRD